MPSLSASNGLKRFWRFESGLFLVIWLVLLSAGRSGLLRDPGTLWHTVVGDQILQTGRLIYADSFTFTFPGRPWIAHQWLGECLMAFVHRLAGFDGLLLGAATLLAGLFTWLGARLTRCGLHWSPTAVLVAIVMAAASSHFHVRPHLGTIVLLGFSFALLLDLEAGRRGLWSLLLLPPAFVLWTNIHGGMLGGVCTVGMASVGWCLLRAVGKASPVNGIREAAVVVGVVAACGFAALVNPYGSLIPRTWREIMDSAVLPHIIQEHAPLTVTRPDGLAVLTLGVLYLLLLAGTLPRWPRVTWLIPLVWLYLSAGRVRHAPLFALTAGLAAADMLPYAWWARWMARPGSDLFRFDPRPMPSRWSHWRAVLIPAGAVMAAVALQVGAVRAPLVGTGWARVDPDIAPAALLGRLEKAVPADGTAVPIFNEYAYGGFLIYHAHFTPGFPAYCVFIDDRCELFGGPWLLDYVRTETSDTGARIKTWEREYGRFRLALTKAGSGYDGFFRNSSAWVRVGEPADGAALYRRSDDKGLTFAKCP